MALKLLLAISVALLVLSQDVATAGAAALIFLACALRLRRAH